MRIDQLHIILVFRRISANNKFFLLTNSSQAHIEEDESILLAQNFNFNLEYFLVLFGLIFMSWSLWKKQLKCALSEILY